MRQEEIINLTWEEINFKHGFIRVGANRTKTKIVRSIPLPPKNYNFFTKLAKTA
jgi:integrase